MLNLADCLVAGFIFLLFVSVYRKRSSGTVRFWMIGWLCVLLHFAALAYPASSELAQEIRSGLAITTLLLCGLVFAMSYPRARRSRKRQLWIGTSLGVPWMFTVLLLFLPKVPATVAVASTVLSLLCTAAVLGMLVGLGTGRFVVGAVALAGCGVWLMTSAPELRESVVPLVLLTMCFGLNAVLFSCRRPRLSAASLTTTFGAVMWALVWVNSSLLAHFAPRLVLSPEIWNLPKYFLAAGMVLSLLDEEMRATEAASEQYRLLFAGNPHPMWVYDPESLRFLEVNDAATACYGYSHEEFSTLTLPEIVRLEEEAKALAELRTAEPQVLSGPWLHRRKDGTEFQVDIASQPLERSGHRATFALMHDVTEPRRLHDQLMRLAHHDGLTGLPNRANFENTLESSLRTAAALGHKVAVFCIDLDRFKQINDTYGHGAGDRCLCVLSERIQKRLQGVGTLARTGGDEFMLVLGALERAGTAEHLASLLLYDMKPAVRLEAGEVELAVSIGVAVYPDDGEDGTHLWRDADAAMYRAKRAGGSQWVRVSPEISRQASEANEIEHSLRRVLKNGELMLSYQPQMTVAGELHCVEALVRFGDPLLSSISAERVIGIAEESGLIVGLGEWVLEEVCRQSRAWSDEGFKPVQIALNLSPLQLNRLNFSLKVASTLEKYRLAPNMLEFEVTESTVMPDRSAAADQIALLARMGVRFSVDDFGTGYSSLGRLHQLPVQALKIDSSFIRAIGERKGTYPTVRAIIALAHTFGLQVVAEGVETEEQLRILAGLHCDRVQGFLFSKPLPAEQVRSFLEAAVLPQWEAQRA